MENLGFIPGARVYVDAALMLWFAFPEIPTTQSS